MPPSTDTDAADAADGVQQRLTTLVAWFEALSPDGLSRIGQLYSPSARFKDPFNHVQGLPAICRIFEHMFRTLAGPRFVVLTRMASGDEAFLTWDFHFRTRGAGARDWRIHGATHLRFDAQGLVDSHRDYWDAAEELYAKLPVLGAAVRWLGRRLQA